MQPISTLQQASAAETRSGGGPLEHPDDWAAEIALIVAMTMEPSCVFSFCFAKRGGPQQNSVRKAPRSSCERALRRLADVQRPMKFRYQAKGASGNETKRWVSR